MTKQRISVPEITKNERDKYTKPSIKHLIFMQNIIKDREKTDYQSCISWNFARLCNFKMMMFSTESTRLLSKETGKMIPIIE